MTAAVTARPPAFAPLALLQLVALVLLAAKLALMALGGTFMDEAYYWLWGQHPALSYYDHPPLNAWMQGLAGSLFGWNRLGLRIMVALALLADMVLLWLIARRLQPDAPQQLFWPTLVLFLATPIFFAVTSVALPDHLLVLGLLAALYFFIGFLDRWPEAGGYRDLFLGALCLGLAALAKYNAVFLAIGLGLFILISPRHRALFGKWQLWTAAALALLVQLPVLAWNMEQGWASFAFILGGRHSGVGLGSVHFVGWLLGVLLFLSPFLLWAIGRFLLGRGGTPGEGLARTVFLVSTLAIAGLSFFTATLFHWNLVAYVAVLPFVASYFHPRWVFWAQVIYGAAFAGFTLVNYAIVPLTDVSAIRDEATAWVYGWEETAAAVTAARAEHGAGFVASPDYTTASLLGYAMGDRDVASLSGRTDQYDFWFDAAAHAGEDAILFGDDWRPLDEGVTGQFDSVTLLREIPVSRFGKPLDTHRIYLGRGFRPHE